MTARKRASAMATTTAAAAGSRPAQADHKSPESTSSDQPIAPPKWGVIVKLSLLFSIPYFYLLFYHYNIEQELKRSILINAGLSLAGFFVTLKMIPVASRYVLRRSLFGYDINKKGTPQGTVKV
ncbi:hypothetical protein SLEP1_g58198 [Rubroshorea leprosula]|uniref:UDP-glcnac-adolichol phosphate glcnac-1-p-transferase n=1 Tax=Rubroshorea leprosula TaxID=152421 RepID=A0AAV5MNN5_9ROSI|nr:hypothetical protein SLEP1_g58198 [Rubroshorea leprosula]